jgi:hypothetical protein
VLLLCAVFPVLGFHSFVELSPSQSFVSPSGVSTEKLSKLSLGVFLLCLKNYFGTWEELI